MTAQRLTVEMHSNPQMDGRHFRKLVVMDEEFRQVGPTVAFMGQMSDQQAENLQIRLDGYRAAVYDEGGDDERGCD